jgi:hypothetical protein
LLVIQKDIVLNDFPIATLTLTPDLTLQSTVTDNPQQAALRKPVSIAVSIVNYCYITACSLAVGAGPVEKRAITAYRCSSLNSLLTGELQYWAVYHNNLHSSSE